MGSEVQGTAAEAVVYLRRAGDEQNKIELSGSALLVVRSGRVQTFSLEEMQSLAFQKRLLLLPLVLGGILLPFGITAMFGGFLNPYLVVVFVLAGMYLLYEGFSSRWVLAVTCKGTRTDIPLQTPTDNLGAFVEFVNARLSGSEGTSAHIFTVMSKEQFHLYDSERFIEPDVLPMRAFTFRQWQSLKADVGQHQYVLRLDAVQDLLRIEFKHDDSDGTLYPYIMGPIPRKAIVERL